MELANPVLSPKVTSPYGWRNLWGTWQFHNGIDYVSEGDEGAANWKGSREVYAIADGTVIFDYDVWVPGDNSAQGSGGNMLIIKHVIDGVVYFVRYLHLATNYVRLNQEVKKGEGIGNFKISAGLSTGPHLHLDVYNVAWQNIDPLPLLRSGGVVVDPK